MGVSRTSTEAEIRQSIGACGVIVKSDAEEFLSIVSKAQSPLVIMSKTIDLIRSSKRYRFSTSYKGLTFFLESDKVLKLSSEVELIEARSIWVPSFL